MTITVALKESKGLTRNGQLPAGMTWRYRANAGDNPNYYPNTVRDALTKAAANSLAELPPDYDPQAAAAASLAQRHSRG